MGIKKTVQSKITQWSTGALKKAKKVFVHGSKAFRRKAHPRAAGLVKRTKDSFRIGGYWRKARRFWKKPKV
jgi:hypothetical protein